VSAVLTTVGNEFQTDRQTVGKREREREKSRKTSKHKVNMYAVCMLQ